MKYMLFLFIVLNSSIVNAGKYEIGDCVISTNNSYSWYGEVARIKSFTKIDGYDGELYILYFPYYKSTDVIFSKDIEQNTTKTNDIHCEK